MKKRAICFLLCIAMLVGMLPVTALAAVEVVEENDCIVELKWEQDGESLYWSSGSEEGAPFPEGVTLEQTEESCVVTLNGANLTRLSIYDWGYKSVTVVVEGENAVTATTEAALEISCCHNVTITGTGVLNLQSQIEALFWHDYYDETGGQGSFAECPDGLFTISGVTINAFNDWQNWDGEEERSEWNCCACYFVGGNLVVTDNARLNASSPSCSGAEGSVTILNGGVINATGWVHNPRGNVNSDDPADWAQTLTVGEGGTMVLKPFSNELERNILLLACDTNLVLDGGVLELDSTEMTGYSDMIWVGSANADRPAATVTINSGEMRLKVVGGDNRMRSGIGMDRGTTWTQNGGNVTISIDPGNAEFTEGLYLLERASYNQYGGTLTIQDLTAGEPAENQHVLGMSMDRGSSNVISGGKIITEGTFSHGWGLASYGDLTISGGELELDGGSTSFSVRTGKTSVLNGNISADGIAASYNGALHILGGTLELRDGITATDGFIRFSGGVTTIAGDPAIQASTVTGTADHLITYADGIAAVYDDGSAVSLTEQDGVWASRASSAITVKKQQIAGDSCNVLMELVNTNSVVAGNAAQIRLSVSLTKAVDTVSVQLPQGMLLLDNSVTINGRSAEYTETETGFAIEMSNGDVLRYSVVPSITGQAVLTAEAGSASAELVLDVKSYMLSLPSSINEPQLQVSGTATPGATVTFIDDGAEIGTATANALGNWSAELNLEPVAGVHDIYAVIELENGSTSTTDVYAVAYDPDTVAVETLTITNMIHGDRESDPPREVSVTINYQDGTKSQNYYTYWPDLPEFTFEVVFADGKGTPDRVYDVNVVATDYYGEEKSVALAYREETGTWIGTGEFCGSGEIVPEMFRVEWLEYEVEEEPTIPLDQVEPYIPQQVEENHADSAMVTADSLHYTFELSEDASGLTVENGAGESVEVVENSFTGESGTIYYAALEQGTFAEFGTDSLCVLMPATGESTWTYQENVYSEDAPSGELQIGDILLSADAAYKIVAIDENGDFEYEEAALEEIFYDLSIDGLGLAEDGEPVIVEEGMAEQLTADFLKTDTYAAYQNALTLYAATTAEDEEKTDEKLESTFEHTVELDDNQIKLTLKPSITLKTEMEAELPEPDGTVKTEVEATFAYTYVLVFDLRTYVEKGTFQGAAFTVDETNSFTVDAKVVVNGEEEEEESINLLQFFGEATSAEDPGKVVEEYLEKLAEPADESQSATLAKVRVRTNIPFVYIAASAELELEEGFNGEVEAGAEVTFGQVYGFYVEPDGDVRTSYKQKAFYAMAEASFHMEADMAVYLKISCGPQLLNVLNASVYGKIGPKLKVGGHGNACISTKAEENSAEAEFWFGETLELAMGYSVKFRALGQKWEISDDLCSYSHPIGFVGTDIMPARFARVEDELYVYDGVNLFDLVDLNLTYQRFSNGLQTGQKVFEPENYRFTIDVGPFTIEQSDDGTATLYVNDGLSDCEGWLKVEYTCPSGSYTLTKLIRIKYSPASIVIHKYTPCCGDRVAGFTIWLAEEVTLESGETEIVRRGVFAQTNTNEEGLAVVPAEAHQYYVVVETAPPDNHECDPPESILFVQQGVASATFFNIEKKTADPEHTSDEELPSNGDPSGYVYEGIISNRLEGVTVKLYRSDASDGENAVLWNASEFDQTNPLRTNVMGEYLWMVPSGWYQVSYEKEGYESAVSDWMEVPPIRTDVNRGLISYDPAEMNLEWSETYYSLVMTFTKPVSVDSVSGLAVTVNGEDCYADYTALDGAWSVTADPADSTVCATAFLVNPYTDNLAGAEVTAAVTAVTYAGTESTVSSGAVQVPENIEPPATYELTVINGSGSGIYAAGEEVTVTAEGTGCSCFEYWIAEGIAVEDIRDPEISIVMPESDATLTAVYTQGEHTFENGICTVCGIGGTAVNEATGGVYTVLADALEAAAEGETVKLLDDAEAGNVLVHPGVTLDLNGHVLTADYAVGFDTAHIIDNAGGGKLVADQKNLVLDEANGMIPVYDRDGYCFTKAGFAINRDNTYTGEGIKINTVACPVNMAVVDLLKDGIADNNLQVMIVLSWDSEQGTRGQTFVFNDAVAAEVYSSNLGTWNQYEKMFSMVITGVESIQNLKANIVLVSGTNVEYARPDSLSLN